jgi:aspartate kinase
LPPVIVLKEKQVMIELSTKDFSFVGEHHTGTLYHLFERYKFKPNLTQNGAISFIAVLDNWPDKIEKLALDASAIFDVQVTRDLSLLTIRHYNREVFEKLTEGKKILLQQRTPEIVQSVLQ